MGTKRKNKVNVKLYDGLGGNFLSQFDIVYVDFGKGIGDEKEGLRPCVVLSNNLINLYSKNVVVAPLTKIKNKTDKDGNIHVLQSQVILDKEQYKKLLHTSIIQLEDIRSVSKERMGHFISKIKNEDQIEIKKASDFVLGF